jgi:NAD(P)-dependent dehydrogenase (short-subunit alcohol dehydrogenase family)
VDPREVLMRLGGKVVFISGSTGMAGATASLAASEGAQVFTAALADADYVGDLTESEHARKALESCMAKYGRIDALFNVAGRSGRAFGDGPVDQCTDEGWDRTLATNLRATFLLSRGVVQHLLARGAPGSVLHMSSVTAFSPGGPSFATHAYAAAKGAVIALTRSMAAHYAPNKINVNCLAPGLVRTPMSLRAQSDPAILDFTAGRQPLAGGMLDPADVARAAVFLLSDEARMITGQVIAVDGGWSRNHTV